MQLRKAVLSLAVLLATLPLTLAQGTYTQIDYPGGYGTTPLAINTAGEIVGFYENSNGSSRYGFLLSNGIYSTIDYPGDNFTTLTGINEVGQIVGQSGVPTVGFIYDRPTQTFTVINRPGTAWVFPFAINNAGAIVGSLPVGHLTFAFELTGSRYMVFSPPRSAVSSAFGITSAGIVFGSAITQGDRQFYFSYSQGRYSTFAIPNAPNYYVFGVNPQGNAVVGEYDPSPGVTAGYVYGSGTLTTLEFPTSEGFTNASAINSAGEVVGQFADSNLIVHGYTWTPPADAAKK